jgi:alkanesulfonate monooxygenase SsuD/methylene tetrahydromethanopterin reductase-like flavin-dependent oxidoreductase (luciferase family)
MSGPNRPGSTRPFRFGVVTTPTPLSSARTLQETARAAADQGYSILLAPDSMFLLSPLPSLAIAAAAADIRVGTFVMSGPLRAPAVAAWEAHSLSILTEGRFELGIGAGFPVSVPFLEAAGLQFPSPAERVRRVEEIVDRLNTLSNGGHVHVTVAAGGLKTRRLAARVADSVILTGDPYMDVAGHSGLVDQFQETAGDRAEQIELLTNLLIVGDSQVDKGLLQAYGLDADRLLESGAVSVLRGGVNEMCGELQRRREILGSSYITISEPLMKQFAPVVERLTGK